MGPAVTDCGTLRLWLVLTGLFVLAIAGLMAGGVAFYRLVDRAADRQWARLAVSEAERITRHSTR
jgi:hypothetical protein